MHIGDKENKNDADERDPKCKNNFNLEFQNLKNKLRNNFSINDVRSEITCKESSEFKAYLKFIMDLHIQTLKLKTNRPKNSEDFVPNVDESLNKTELDILIKSGILNNKFKKILMRIWGKVVLLLKLIYRMFK